MKKEPNQAPEPTRGARPSISDGASPLDLAFSFEENGWCRTPRGSSLTLGKERTVTAMLLPKERLKIVLLFLGIVCGACGVFSLGVFQRKEDRSPRYVKGTYADAVSSGALKDYAPWLIAVGGFALLGAFLLRDK